MHIEFPADLPVSARKDEIEAAIAAHQVVIVAGETGSGKTTQLPKMALEMGRKSIAHTQPRRIAARAIAERLCEELDVSLGETVGYQVRFTDQSSARTRVKIMTDGVLLNEIHRDRLLRRYDTIIIDEAHERSLNIDFLLGYLRQLLPKRPDLKLIITSATIDPEKFSKFFMDAPIIEVSGRTFPVDILYRPLIEHTERADGSVKKVDRTISEGVLDAVHELPATGDILVFLSGEAEIRDVQDALDGSVRSGALRGTEVLPLYGRLPAAQQHKVFDRSRPTGIIRRIVLATNVAETSLTVPGIRYVIDGGQARISRYSTRAKVQRLPIEAISQASAAQRSGRAGRTSAGIAIRLYAEDDFAARDAYTTPEILRTNLASVLLQMLSLGIQDVSRFPFLTPPDSGGVRDGMTLLRELGAIRGTRLTRTGKQLAALPMEPRFARMIVEGAREHVLDDVIVIVAGLTIQDPRERPLDKQQQADTAHKRFADERSDFMALLNLWRYIRKLRKQLSGNQFRKRVMGEYLHYQRVREWSDVIHQIDSLTKNLRKAYRDTPDGAAVATPNARAQGTGRGTHRGGKDARRQPMRTKQDSQRNTGQRTGSWYAQTHEKVAANSELAAATNAFDEDGIHTAILSGLLSQLGFKDGRANPSTSSKARRGPVEYLGSRGIRFSLHPSSALAKHPPELVMSAELVETSRLFARMNAIVDPVAAEQLAGDLAKHNYSEPHWEASRGSAVGYERVTLFGVPLVERRKIQWTRVDRSEARDLFIQHAFVQAEWEQPPAFERANRKLRKRLEQMEERARRRDILDTTDVVFDFYAQRIPESVTSCSEFDKWWRKQRATKPELFAMDEQLLLAEDAPEVDEREFPREWHSGDQRLQLRYRFDPGADDDGVTIRVPLPLLPRLESASFDGLVPGMRLELVTALIKSLPKPIRRHVVPAADWANRLLAEITPKLDQDGAQLLPALAYEIRHAAGMPVSVTDFDLTKLPQHLKPTYAVVADSGKTVGSGKSLADLQREFKDAARESVAHLATGKPRRPHPNAESGASMDATKASGASVVERDDVQTWDFGDLPKYVDVRHGSTTVRAYPALVASGSAHKPKVALRVVATAEVQQVQHRLGVRQLLAMSTPSPASYIKEHLTSGEKLLLATAPYGDVTKLIADILLALADAKATADLFTQQAFDSARAALGSGVMERTYAAIGVVCEILDQRRLLLKELGKLQSLSLLSVRSEIKQQVDELVYPGFITDTTLVQLPRLAVYLHAARMRLQKLVDDPMKVRAASIEVAQAAELYSAAGGTWPLPVDAPKQLIAARWMLEELRVQAFAQQLGVQGQVSLQRLKKLLSE